VETKSRPISSRYLFVALLLIAGAMDRFVVDDSITRPNSIALMMATELLHCFR
jgi:hypothetical protein